MIHKILIANRGEIAARIIRTCRRLGIGTVAVHSEADARALHAEAADEKIEIGPGPAKDSYLKIEQVLAAAKDSGADAVHPGYGFLSENADFARACRDAGLLFVGPPTEAIEAMGSKTAARDSAQKAKVPVIPGSGALADLDEARAQAERIGYPVLLKPSEGGGGIAMVRVRDAKELEQRFATTQEKAQSFFGDGTLYVEKALERPRHIEVQLAGDESGALIHLGERECSIQRRHQKVVEESPSPAVDDGLRQRMCEAALRLGKAVGYASLGTVEMLLDGNEFYFLEMNTRLQVEHTVTEMITGLDLVEWQIRIALGEPLPAAQEDIAFQGHAIECRIYAEDPDRGFLPSPGQITRFVVPMGPGLRNDAGVREGDFVTPFYDPMIAKLIVHGDDRSDAVARLRRALADYQVEGIKTNVGLHRRIVEHAAFAAGNLSTSFLSDELGLKI